MSINMEQLRAQWRAELARITERVDDLRAKIDTESRELYTSLYAEIAALQSDIKTLHAEVDSTGRDSYGQRIVAQIEELRAKGDAAYDLLRIGLANQLDPTDAEIRQLEMAAAAASEDARAKIYARIDELKSSRSGTQLTSQANALAARNTDISEQLPG